MKKSTCLFLAISSSFLILNAQNISTFAGNGKIGYSGDGGLATAAEMNGSVDVAFDRSGNLYVAD
ncbi:MAG TPA: hypothetical protein VNZ45_11505, partial [Bacteroidia bacterium]|nr:hypothetical protein [Bacteroidia bacterium]